MGNRLILASLKKTILICVIAILLGIGIGIIIESNFPSNYQFAILYEEDIFQNNITVLFNSIKNGFISFGIYSLFFATSYGKIVGHGIVVLFRDYGMKGVVLGFFPHALIETSCCLCATILPVFCWYAVLNVFIRKSNINKWMAMIRIMAIVVVLVLLVVLLCVLAAHIEYYISEMYWMNEY